MNVARCFSGTHATVRVTEEAVVTSGSCVECVLTWAMSKWRKTVGLSLKSRIKSLSWRKDLKLNDVEVKALSWRKDLKLNAALCFSGTHVTVRFTKETFVTSGCCIKCVLTWAMSKWAKHIVTINEEEDEDTLVEEGLQIERGTVFLRDTCHSEMYPRNIRDRRFPREACFDEGDVTVVKNSVTLNEERGGSRRSRGGRTANLTRLGVSQGHTPLRFSKEAFVTSASREKFFFDLGDVKVENVMVTFSEQEDEDTLVEEGP